MMNRTHPFRTLALACTLCVLGCSGEESSSGSGGKGTSSSTTGSGSGSSTSGSSSSAASSSGSGSGGMDCTPVANPAAAIDETFVNQDAPTASGGAIVDGIYELTERVFYTGPTGMTGTSGKKFTETASIQNVGAGKLYIKATQSINGAEQSLFFTATVSGTTITTVGACGGTLAPVWGYDASPTGMKFYATVNNMPGVAVFVKK